MNKQFIYFLIIGGIGFVIDAGGIFLLNQIFDISPILLRIPSFGLAIVTTFTLHKFFTFKDRKNDSWIKTFLKYLSTTGISQGTNFGIYSALVAFIPFFHTNPFYAVAIGSISVIFLSFTLCKHWAFK